jgi:hypothetical protein
MLGRLSRAYSSRSRLVEAVNVFRTVLALTVPGRWATHLRVAPMQGRNARKAEWAGQMRTFGFTRPRGRVAPVTDAQCRGWLGQVASAPMCPLREDTHWSSNPSQISCCDRVLRELPFKSASFGLIMPPWLTTGASFR